MLRGPLVDFTLSVAILEFDSIENIATIFTVI